MTDALADDRHLSLSIPATIAERLEDVAARHGITLAELVRRLSGHLVSIADIIPDAAFRPRRAEKEETPNDA